MNNELKEFQNSFLADIKSQSESEMMSDRAVFVNEVVNMMIEVGELDGFDSAYFDSYGAKNRRILIDGYYYNAMMKELTLIVAEYEGIQTNNNLTRSRIEKVSRFALNFMDNVEKIHNDAEESSEAWAFADYILHFWDDVQRIKVIVVSDMQLSNYVKSIDSDIFRERKVAYSVWGIQRIHEVEMSKNVNEDIEINLDEYFTDGLHALQASIDVNEEYDAYMAIVPADGLADMFNDHGAKLLEGNVRSFLSNRGKVNRAIRGTLRNLPHRFFAYNNGIAATAEHIETKVVDNAVRLKKVHNLQIVNGGQTTASIFNAKYVDKIHENLKNVFVPMKLSIVSKEKAEELIPEIAKTANTQNKVSQADFFSNHPFHVKIETLSKKLQAPALEGEQYGTYWFYERARGQYNQNMLKMTESQKKAFKRRHPKRQVITKTDLAKYYHSYAEKPHIVSLGAQRNFLEFAKTIAKKWDEKESQFNKLFYQTIVDIAILFKHSERLVSKADWYQNAFRANIVTYTLALFFHILRRDYPNKTIDFNKIWNMQNVPDEVHQELEVISYKVFLELTKESNNRTRNITEWAKKKEAWDEIKSHVHHSFSENFSSALIDRKKVDEKTKQEEKEQRISDKMKIQHDVVRKGEKFWKRVYDFAIKNKMVGEIDLGILKLASTMESKGKVPTERQAGKLDEILKQAESEGFTMDGV